MIIQVLWLTKLVLAHLITDFILQPRSWVKDKNQRHFASPKLYLHAVTTALVAWCMVGWQYWIVALVILVTHLLIDGWKSYRRSSSLYFLADQLLHLMVIAGCWYFVFIDWPTTVHSWKHFTQHQSFWIYLTAYIFVSFPSGIIIGQFTKQWRDKVTDAESLGNAGKWIGILERLIVLTFVLLNEFGAIGLLVAAKGIIRFNEKDRPEAKTEYLVIGTLLSIAFAIATGLLVNVVR